MKNLIVFLCLGFLVFNSCVSETETYEVQLNAEKKAISDYIKRNNIIVTETKPKVGEWGTNIYYKTPNGLYIHIVDNGVEGDTIVSGAIVLARYYKISLTTPPDTVSRYWDPAIYPYPYEFPYQISDGYTSLAFHEAAGIMKNHNSVAKIIVPSKLGNDIDSESVTPYFYDLKIKISQ